MKLLSFIFMLISGSAWGATTGSLPMKGKVPKVINITVTPRPIASTLPLNTSQVNTIVADVNESWNTLAGVKIKITSANLGKLRHQSVTSSVINYTLRYRGTNIALTSAAGTTINVSSAGVQNVTNTASMSYTGIAHSSLIEGDYSDTVTFAISAN